MNSNKCWPKIERFIWILQEVHLTTIIISVAGGLQTSEGRAANNSINFPSLKNAIFKHGCQDFFSFEFNYFHWQLLQHFGYNFTSKFAGCKCN